MLVLLPNGLATAIKENMVTALSTEGESPVMNAKGELIGIAFDGNWEAMSGDIAFEPELQRCINVDIRFVCQHIVAHLNLDWSFDLCATAHIFAANF